MSNTGAVSFEDTEVVDIVPRESPPVLPPQAKSVAGGEGIPELVEERFEAAPGLGGSGRGGGRKPEGGVGCWQIGPRNLNLVQRRSL